METSFSEETSHRLEVSYRLLFEKNPLPMWVYDVKTLRMLAVNNAAVARYGYSDDEIFGLTLLDLHHIDDLPAVQAHLKIPISEQTAKRLWRHKHRRGGYVEVETVTSDVELDGNHARLMLVRDLTGQRRAEMLQRELVERLATTLESITDAFFTLDLDWRFTYVNERAAELLRTPSAKLLGSNLWDTLPAAVGSVVEIECQRAMREGKTVRFEAFIASAHRWVAVDAYPSAQGLTVYFRDVIDKHAAEMRLLEERETLMAVVNSAADAIISTDAQGLIKMFSPAAERIFRHTQASVLGQSIDMLMPERFRVAHQLHLQRFIESGSPTRMMGLGLVKGLRADGQELDMEVTISQVTVQQQQVLITNMRDVTERVRADAEFEQSRAQLSDLTKKLMMQEKTLVRRLAQSLHDQLGQTMAAIRMAHETILTLQTGPTLPSIQRLQAQMGTLISQAIGQVRKVLIDLRPPLLDEHGLAEALDNELRNRSLTQPQIDISILAQPEIATMRWPPEVEYAAFMVAREALENALRHSGASSVAVHLSGTGMSLKLEVADNGVGIAPGALVRIGHLGILGMNERAHAIGATVTIGSGETPGARVCFNWQALPFPSPLI